MNKKFMITLRSGQRWILFDKSFDYISKEWGNKRPPKRITIRAVHPKNYSVLVYEYSNPIDSKYFLNGVFRLLIDSDEEPFEIYRRMPAISIKQPWAWAIMEGHQPIINTDCILPSNIAGKDIWLHASDNIDVDGIEQLRKLGIRNLPQKNQYNQRVILGSIKIVKSVDTMAGNPWYSGPIAWIVETPILLPHPVKCEGRKGFWIPNLS